jgi:ABC-type nitrate/sulfonate/bicarbonate transport system substrate-binding protein
VQVIGLTWTEHNSRLLALPGSAIESAADLRGKRLALLRRPVRAG